jgi:hypothetical protein
MQDLPSAVVPWLRHIFPSMGILGLFPRKYLNNMRYLKRNVTGFVYVAQSVQRETYIYIYIYIYIYRLYIYIYKNVTVHFCVVCSKSQSSESCPPMALQFGHNVAGEYARVWI